MVPISLPPAFRSDGCTFPFWILTNPLRWAMGAGRYTEYCREHDFLRRYAVIPWMQANWLLARRVAASGWRGKLRAPLYLIFTTVSYPAYNNTHQLPTAFVPYARRYQ